MSMFIGEALAGDGNEIAHIDLLIGPKTGPVGTAFANALANQSHGHTNLLAVLTPNLLCKPATVLITKVTIKDLAQATQMFGPAQAAVARAVADSVADGVIPAASQGVTALRASYEANRASLLALLEATRTLADARLDRIDAEARLATARADLARALGDDGGVVPMEDMR